MTWNYRVLHRTYTVPGTDHLYDNYSIHEVYYDDEGKPNGWTDAIAARGDTRGECRSDYLLMDQAFDKPTLRVNADESLTEET